MRLASRNVVERWAADRRHREMEMMGVLGRFCAHCLR